MAITMHATSTPNPSAKTSCSSLQSNHSSQSIDTQNSSSSFGCLSCITVRKEDPTAKAGIQMEQDANGQVTVTKIASNGLFAKTELSVGDVVLAVNKKRLSKGEGPEALMNIVHKYATISISVRKASSVGAPLKRRSKEQHKEDGLSLLSGSTHHHKMKPRKSSQDNNNFKSDTYYGGMALHNPDGSLRIQRINDLKIKKETIQTLTISATKPQPKCRDPTRSEMGNKSFGSILPRTRSKSPHSNRNRLDSKSSHGRTPRRNRSNGSGNRNKNQQSIVGLDFEIIDGRLVVKAIRAKSIFRSTNLRLGDVILSINDMSFRRFADAEYATTIMDKASLMVTLVIERTIDDYDDTTTVDDDDSISSFGNEEGEDDGNESFAYDGDTSHAFHCSFGSYGEIIETDFKIEKYRPVTISVPKSSKSQGSGLVFKMVRTQKQGLFNPTISHMHPDAPAHPQKSLPSRGRRSTWIYVDSISNDSIFKNTSLRRGDKVVCINNTNLRNNPDPRAAYQACQDSMEAIAMVVLKDDHSIYKEKGFAFDRSSSDLNWNP